MKAAKFIRIVCEGEMTEPNYFRGILKHYGLNNGRVIKPKDNSPMGIVKEAKELRKQAIRARIPQQDIIVWAVFDRDGHVRIQDALVMARDNNICVAFSNVCFEYFILLHYEKVTRPFTRCDEVIKYIIDNHDSSYLKNNNHFLNLKDKISDAINHNNWLISTHWIQEINNGDINIELNPYTNVYELVKFLLAENKD